jgi:hypothetical protein
MYVTLSMSPARVRSSEFEREIMVHTELDSTELDSSVIDYIVQWNFVATSSGRGHPQDAPTCDSQL